MSISVTIPVHAGPRNNATAAAKDLQFYVFDVPDDVKLPQLFVQAPCASTVADAARVSSDAVTPWDPKNDAVCYPWTDVAAEWQDAPVYVISIDTPNDAPVLASRLVAQGYSVSGCAASATTPAPTMRLKHTVFRAVKNCVDEMRGAADTLCSLATRSAAKSTAATGPQLLLYDEEYHVPRLMMSWSIVAMLVAQADVRPAVALTEPLATYVAAAAEVTRCRNARVLPDTSKLAASVRAAPAAKKLTPDEIMDATCLFYWCALHADAETAPLPLLIMATRLESYLAYGHVVQRKRAYEFRSDRPRKRRSATM